MAIIGSSGFEGRAKIAYDEMSSLVNMAINLQSELRKKRRELQNTIMYYILFTSLLATAFIILKMSFSSLLLDRENLLPLSIVFMSFVVFTFISAIKIKNTNDDIKYDTKNLRDLMEIIFNLRKIFNLYNFEPEYLHILDLKLRRLRFY